MIETLRVLPDPEQLRSQAARLAEAAGEGRTSATAYDTAFLAGLRSPHTASSRLFPAAVSWLRSNQHSDGSWGAAIPHAHDRLVSTLAAVAALVDVDETWARDAVIRALGFVARSARTWINEYPDTIGFELVMPRLVELSQHAGLRLPYDDLRPIERIRAAKLARIPPERLFDGSGNLAFSCEFLSDATADQLRKLKTENGSYACSPSASAAAWAVTGDLDTLSYLQSTALACGDGGAPAINPMDVFDRAWVLGPLAAAGLLGVAAHAPARFLMSALGPGGAAASRVGPAPDSDTTAMSIIAAQAAGQDCTGKFPALLSYEADDHFRCFEFERDPSVSANARVRHALGTAAMRYPAQIRKVDAFLADTRTAGGYWHDKWHLSPFYTTAVVVGGGARDRPWPWDLTRRWVLDNQRPDGSWGAFRGTSEETAYAVMMLGELTGAEDRAAEQAIARGAAFLVAERGRGEHPELWIAKSLYAPLNVIRAYVLAALAVSVRRLRSPA